MTNSEAILAEYHRAIERNTAICATDPSCYHPPDIITFRSLRTRLVPFADSGDMHCQYALATILFLGLCYTTEDEQHLHRSSDIAEASILWDAAAAQGSAWAIDNLITSGVGPAAERARAEARRVEQERSDLVPWRDDHPVYGPNFMETVRRRIYANTTNA